MGLGTQAAASWRVETAVGLTAWQAWVPAWVACWERSAGKDAFLHPDWQLASAAAFEAPRLGKLQLYGVWHAGQLRAVLPTVRERGWFRGLPVRRLRGPGSVHTLRCGVLAEAGGLGEEGVRQLARHLRHCGGWDVLELRDVAAGDGAEVLLDELERQGCRSGRWLAAQAPYIDLSGGGGMQRTSADFRARLRRWHRRLEQARPGSQLRLLRPPVSRGELARQLEAFYALEGAGWKGQQGSAIRCQPVLRRFYDLAAAAMAERGVLALYRLEWDGQLLAMSYGLCDRGRYEAIKWAYDESYAHFAPGHLLIEAIVQTCVQERLGRMNFNGPTMPYKSKWTDCHDSLHFLYAFPPTPLGAALYQLKFIWTPRLRRLFAFRRHGGDG